MSDTIGALWIKEAKTGRKYMSGEITVNDKKIKIVVFKNVNKKDKQPDYNILESRPRNNDGDVPF